MITLWIPSVSPPAWNCIQSWWDLETPEPLRLVRSGANNVKYSWNKVVKDFLATDDEWLFSVHDDVVLDKETLTRLLSWNEPLVSALIFMRQSPVVPHIWRTDERTQIEYSHRILETRDWFMKHQEYIKFGAFTMNPRPDDALQEIEFTSTSCSLIHRSVLETMREPVNELWFKWDDDINGGGEDRNFFDNARACGFQPYIDRSAVVGHNVGAIPTSSADFIMWSQSSVFHNTGESHGDN